jgi:hypothetical protein
MNTAMNKRSAIAVGGAIGLAVLAMSCASTEMTSTWTDPSARGAALSRIAVVCLTKDAGARRMCEDAAASQLLGVQATPSYQALGDTELRNREAVKAQLKSAGFQGVLVMRMTGVTEQVTAVDGPYGTFDGYYNWAGAAVYDPGYLQTDTVVHVISDLFSLQGQEKLIWSGVSQTFDPASSKSAVVDVSKAVAKSMQKDRVIM